MGATKLTGVFERFLEGPDRWQGMPDLVLWRLCRGGRERPCSHRSRPGGSAGIVMLVEVKSPNDSLSSMQELWLKWLHELGVLVAKCDVVIDYYVVTHI